MKKHVEGFRKLVNNLDDNGIEKLIGFGFPNCPNSIDPRLKNHCEYTCSQCFKKTLEEFAE